jgi:hypothetical protein
VKDFNRCFLLVNIFLHKLILRPTATTTFSIFLTYTSSNNEEIFIQYHWLISSIKKASPYHDRSGENKGRSKTGAALGCTKIKKNYKQKQKQQQKTTTKNNNKQQQLITRT